MTMIEKIYYNIEKLMDNNANSDGVEAANKKLNGFLTSKGISNVESEEYVNELTDVTEKQGFIEGFQMAVALFTNGGGALV